MAAYRVSHVKPKINALRKLDSYISRRYDMPEKSSIYLRILWGESVINKGFVL